MPMPKVVSPAACWRINPVFVSNSVIGVWPLLSLHAGNEKIEWEIGPVARDCVHYFNAVLGA